MYSHGPSARVGVGKRGHGGRNYRPPKERNQDPSVLTPPPLKACDCMIQLDIPEYAQLAPPTAQGQRCRRHWSFPGTNLNERKRSLAQTEKRLRSKFGVHLVVPGRKQTGPLAVAGKSVREVLPAVDYLMRILVLDGDHTNTAMLPSNGRFLTGRIMRNVKDPNDVVLAGRFLQPPTLQTTNERNDLSLHPYWLFESPSWSVVVCPLSLSETETADNQSSSNKKQHQVAIAEALQISFDNLRFRMGNAALSNLQLFLHSPPPVAPKDNTIEAPTLPEQRAFAMGDPTSSAIRDLFREIQQTRVVLPEIAPNES